MKIFQRMKLKIKRLNHKITQKKKLNPLINGTKVLISNSFKHQEEI